MLYTIQKGDTLGRLAKRFKTGIAELAKRNKIADVNKIYAGATLDIPDATDTAHSAPQAQSAADNAWSRPEVSTQSAPDFSYTPAPYKSAYADEIEELMKSIESRPDFSYDYSEDPLYENYRDSYTDGGRLAMQDAMGEAAALTGGYGSSYAQSVGQQTYQAYMRALSDKVPDLAQSAYDKYKDEENALLGQLANYSELDAAAYARYRDDVEAERKNRELAYAQYRDAQKDALERYKLEQAARENEREWAYRQTQDEQAAQSAAQRKSASKGSAQTGARGESGEAEAVYALFEGMNDRERKAIFSDLPSIEYMRKVLGDTGYAALRRKYGLS